MAEAVASELVQLIEKISAALGEMSRQHRADRAAVDLLFAISHTHHRETVDLLKVGKATLSMALERSTDASARAELEALIKRFDELIAIRKTGFQPPSVH